MSTNNNIPFIWNEEQDDTLFSSLFPQGMNAPSFQNNQSNLFQELSSENSIEKRSNQYALSSPFGENSIFHPNFNIKRKEEEVKVKVILQSLNSINNNDLDYEKDSDFKFGWWTTDYEGKNNVAFDQYHLYRSSLDKTVYFQIEVSDRIKIGTSISFQLYDYDGIFNPDDKTFNNKEIIKLAKVRVINNQKRITLELFLSPTWGSNIAEEKGFFANGNIELYWQWKFNNIIWTSKTVQLNVYPSELKLHLKPVLNDGKYSLPEIYNHKGEIIIFAIDQLPDGEIKKFVSITIRNTVTYKSLEEVNKFYKEVFTERINLDTNNIEAAGYEVTELNNYFKIKNDATNIFIEEEMIEVPVEKGTKLAYYNSLYKGVKIIKNAIEYYGYFDIFNQTRNMFPELSNNNQFNLPSLSTFVGLVPGADVIAFGIAVVEWMLKDQMEDDNKLLDEILSVDWQNAKKKGLDVALDFIQTSWARDNGFEKTYVSQEILDLLLKGKYKSLKELTYANILQDDEKKYVVISYRIENKELDTFTDVIDCIFINE